MKNSGKIVAFSLGLMVLTFFVIVPLTGLDKASPKVDDQFPGMHWKPSNDKAIGTEPLTKPNDDMITINSEDPEPIPDDLESAVLPGDDNRVINNDPALYEPTNIKEPVGGDSVVLPGDDNRVINNDPALYEPTNIKDPVGGDSVVLPGDDNRVIDKTPVFKPANQKKPSLFAHQRIIPQKQQMRQAQSRNLQVQQRQNIQRTPTQQGNGLQEYNRKMNQIGGQQQPIQNQQQLNKDNDGFWNY